MEKFINLLINDATVGVDKYVNNGSTWLIFTEDKRWVIELTKEGTLWYNYNFFKNLFNYISMDVVENQSYITKWVEDNIINGVKDTKENWSESKYQVEETIENGVKNITKVSSELESLHYGVEDTIENGVKHTEYGDWLDGDGRLDDIIENGVKKTISEEHHRLREVVVTLKNGIKEVNPLPSQDGNRDWGIYYYRKEDKTKPFTEYVKEVIENGEKF